VDHFALVVRGNREVTVFLCAVESVRHCVYREVGCGPNGCSAGRVPCRRDPGVSNTTGAAAPRDSDGVRPDGRDQVTDATEPRTRLRHPATPRAVGFLRRHGIR
jgi:hypothetical protein